MNFVNRMCTPGCWENHTVLVMKSTVITFSKLSLRPETGFMSIKTKHFQVLLTLLTKNVLKRQTGALVKH